MLAERVESKRMELLNQDALDEVDGAEPVGPVLTENPFLAGVDDSAAREKPAKKKGREPQLRRLVVLVFPQQRLVPLRFQMVQSQLLPLMVGRSRRSGRLKWEAWTLTCRRSRPCT